MTFCLKLTDVAVLLGIPVSRLRYRVAQLPGPWARRENQRLAWPEILSLAAVGQFCESYPIEIGVFSDSITDLVELFCEHSPAQLQDQRLLYQDGRKEFRLMSRDADTSEIVADRWLAIELDEVLQDIWSRLYSPALVTGDDSAIRSAA